MKNYLYGLLFISILASCKNKSGKQTVTDSTKTVTIKSTTSYQNPLFTQYASYVKKLDDKKPESATLAAKKFVELFKGKDTITCDNAFVIFNKFYKQMAESLEEANEKDDIDLDKYYATDDAPQNVSPKVAGYVATLRQNGFDVAATEGTTYITQDWDLVAKYFYDLVSPSMKEFLQELNIENKQVYQEDAGITLGADTLVDRAVWWERFEKKHPAFMWRDEVSATKKEYLEVLLKGMDNTPVFEDNKFSPYFEKAYGYMAVKYPDTKTYQTAKPVFELLKEGKQAEANKLVEQYGKQGLLTD